jgi:hypothetical protein
VRAQSWVNSDDMVGQKLVCVLRISNVFIFAKRGELLSRVKTQQTGLLSKMGCSEGLVRFRRYTYETPKGLSWWRLQILCIKLLDGDVEE